MSDYVNHTVRKAERQHVTRKQEQLLRHAAELVLAGEVDEFRLQRKGRQLRLHPVDYGKPESA